MAKHRKTGYDRPVTETDNGEEWTVKGRKFRFDGWRGVNLFVEVNGAFLPLTFARTLTEAGIFAEGYVAGLEHGPILFPVESDTVDLADESALLDPAIGLIDAPDNADDNANGSTVDV